MTLKDATINEIHPVNQHIEIKDYLSSNIWKRIYESGLQQRYNEGQEFALNLSMLGEVTISLQNDVILGFEKLRDYLHKVHFGDADNLLEHFEDSNIGGY